jgi:hypothetical protein
MSNFDKHTFTHDLGVADVGNPMVRTYVIAEPGFDQRGGAWITFTAVRRGPLYNELGDRLASTLPVHLRSAEFTQALVTESFFSNVWRHNPDSSLHELMLAEQIIALGRGEIGGESSASAIWNLFWHLIVMAEESDFIDAIGMGFMSKLREDALARA